MIAVMSVSWDQCPLHKMGVWLDNKITGDSPSSYMVRDFPVTSVTKTGVSPHEYSPSFPQAETHVSLHVQLLDDGGSKHFWNFGKLLPNYHSTSPHGDSHLLTRHRENLKSQNIYYFIRTILCQSTVLPSLPCSFLDEVGLSSFSSEVCSSNLTSLLVSHDFEQPTTSLYSITGFWF
jgi:hypothetical protein